MYSARPGGGTPAFVACSRSASSCAAAICRISTSSRSCRPAPRPKCASPALDEEIDVGIVGFERQHDAAAQESRRQLALLVGGDHHQRQAGARPDRLARHRVGELAAAEHFEQAVRQVAVGLVDLVDQDHVAARFFRIAGRRFCGRCRPVAARVAPQAKAARRVRAASSVRQP
jgi:hypothetical protein